MNTAQRMTNPALLDLLDMTRGWHPVEEEQGATLAECWAYAPSEVDGLAGTLCQKVGEHDDIYALVQSLRFTAGRAKLPADTFAVALVTWGWAAPIDPDGGAPSQHPERRRVRLVALVTTDGARLSRIHFYATGETVDEEAGGEGPLADALAAIFA